jgi:hypothetical protein
VESVVRRQAALFSDDLTFLVTPTPRLERFWAETEALKATGDPSRGGGITDATTDQVDGD